MSVAVVVLLVVELVLGVVLLQQIRAVRARGRAVTAEVVPPDANVAPPDGELGGRHTVTPLITVEILNAQELAARESWAARRFGSLVPRWVGREVADRVAAQMTAQLADQGVRAEVRIVDGQQHTPGGTVPVRVPEAADRVSPVAEDAVEATTRGVRDVHLAVSAIPFDLLDRVPPARAVRAVHDRITGGVYDAVSAMNRVVGDLRRR